MFQFEERSFFVLWPAIFVLILFSFQRLKLEHKQKENKNQKKRAKRAKRKKKVRQERRKTVPKKRKLIFQTPPCLFTFSLFSLLFEKAERMRKLFVLLLLLLFVVSLLVQQIRSDDDPYLPAYHFTPIPQGWMNGFFL